MPRGPRMTSAQIKQVVAVAVGRAELMARQYASGWTLGMLALKQGLTVPIVRLILAEAGVQLRASDLPG